MKTKKFKARLCCVLKSCAEVEIEAETHGDAHVIAQRLADKHQVNFCATDEHVEVESVFPITTARATTARATTARATTARATTARA